MKPPYWLRKSDFERLRTMEPSEALAEAGRLHREYKEKKAAYYQANKERMDAYSAAYQRKFKKKARAASRRSYAKLKEDPEWLAAYNKQRSENRRKRGYKREYTEALRERDRRRRQRIKTQMLAQTKPDELSAMIKQHVPLYLDAPSRMDVINAVTVQALARNVPFNDLAAWVRKAVTEHNRQFDYFKTISIDTPIAGTDDLRLIDRIEADAFHF